MLRLLITCLLSAALLLGAGVANQPLAAEATRYTCGMHPMIVVDEPGLCPICQMELTPVKNGSGGGSSQTIVIDPATVQKMGLRTASVERRDLVRRIRTVGLVGYEEPGQVAVNSKTGGWVEKLYVNQAGQSVKKGEPLLELYSPELVAAQEELLLAVENARTIGASGFADAAKSAGELLEAARRRLQLWDITPQQIRRLEKSAEVQKTLVLYAPVTGVVSRKQVREGEFVPPGRELLEVSDISRVWVYADIYEYEIPWVHEGQTALVQFPFASEPVRGVISTVYPYLEAKTRTLKARIDLDNPGLNLKPDMYADVLIEAEPKRDVPSIPAEAVLYSGKRETAFVALGEGRFEPRQVKVGLQDEEGYVEILDGVKLGEQVVTSAQFMLDSESKLREVLQKMLEPAETKRSENLDELFN